VLTYVMSIQEEEGRTRVRGEFIQVEFSRDFEREKNQICDGSVKRWSLERI